MPTAEVVNDLVRRIRLGEKPPATELAEAVKAMLGERITNADVPKKKKAASVKVEPGMLDDLLKS